MPSETDETMPVRTSEDVVRVRQAVRVRAVGIGLSLVDQTKLITAASEIARNTVEYGGGGTMRLEVVQNGIRRGVRLTFDDKGPGITDLNLAMTEGWTSGGGLGLGLTGARRLCNEFDLRSEVGKGTTVTLVRWK